MVFSSRTKRLTSASSNVASAKLREKRPAMVADLASPTCFALTTGKCESGKMQNSSDMSEGLQWAINSRNGFNSLGDNRLRDYHVRSEVLSPLRCRAHLQKMLRIPQNPKKFDTMIAVAYERLKHPIRLHRRISDRA